MHDGLYVGSFVGTFEPRLVEAVETVGAVVVDAGGSTGVVVVVHGVDETSHGVRGREVAGFKTLVRRLVFDVPLRGELGAGRVGPRLVDARVRGARVVGEARRRLRVPAPRLEDVHAPRERRVGTRQFAPEFERNVGSKRKRHRARPAPVAPLAVLQKLSHHVRALLVRVYLRRPGRGFRPEASGKFPHFSPGLVEDWHPQRVGDDSHSPPRFQRVHQAHVAPVALPHVPRAHRARPKRTRR